MLSAVMTRTAASRYEAYAAAHASDDTPVVAPSSVDVLIATLEEIDYGMMVLDPTTRRLRHANRIAMIECRSNGTLLLEQGQVHARNLACRQQLESALALVASDRRSLVTLQGERGSASIAIVPVPDGHGGRLALLVLGKREMCEPLSVSLYSRLHALTPSEDAVLKALCRGLRPAEIAAECGVAISTVRTQVSSIRMKTRTTSIHDLVRTMATLPPINPALRMVRLAN